MMNCFSWEEREVHFSKHSCRCSLIREDSLSHHIDASIRVCMIDRYVLENYWRIFKRGHKKTKFCKVNKNKTKIYYNNIMCILLFFIHVYILKLSYTFIIFCLQFYVL